MVLLAHGSLLRYNPIKDRLWFRFTNTSRNIGLFLIYKASICFAEEVFNDTRSTTERGGEAEMGLLFFFDHENGHVIYDEMI